MNEKEKKPQNKIRELRKEKGLSIDKLAQKIGVSRATINNYETGTHEPKFETWQLLAAFFGVTVPYLQGINDEKNNEYTKVSKLLNELNQDNINNGDVLNCIYKEVPQFCDLNKMVMFYMQVWEYLRDRFELKSAQNAYRIFVKKQDQQYYDYLNSFSLSSEDFTPKKTVEEAQNFLLEDHWQEDLAKLPDEERKEVITAAKAFIEGLIQGYSNKDASGE